LGFFFDQSLNSRKIIPNFLRDISHRALTLHILGKCGLMGGIPGKGGVTLGKGGKEPSGGRFKYLF